MVFIRNMSADVFVLLLVTIGLLACGQVLFKLASQGIDLRQPSTFLTSWMVTALTIYAIATVLWVFVLSKVPLSTAFPFYGLTFLLVPVLAAVFLQESLDGYKIAGGLIIMGGIAVSVQSPSAG